MQTHTSFQSFVDTASVDSDFFNPICKNHCLLYLRHPYVIALVSGLNSSNSPIAILGRVWAIIIAALYRVKSSGARPDILQEIFKAQPALTYCNPTTAVIGKCGITWIKTTPFHQVPNSIFRFFAFAGISSFYSLTGQFSAQAATRFSSAGAQLNSQNRLFVSAIAVTKPIKLLRSALMQSFNDSEPTEPFVYKIDKCSHFLIVAKRK